jgi:hypothetical protein
MTTGQAYGPGIYLAGHSSISAGYMGGGGEGWPKSMFGGTGLSCIAVAEGRCLDFAAGAAGG